VRPALKRLALLVTVSAALLLSAFIGAIFEFDQEMRERIWIVLLILVAGWLVFRWIVNRNDHPVDK
jgi:hypothetical protein